jgi:hypothetical protein
MSILDFYYSFYLNWILYWRYSFILTSTKISLLVNSCVPKIQTISYEKNQLLKKRYMNRHRTLSKYLYLQRHTVNKPNPTVTKKNATIFIPNQSSLNIKKKEFKFTIRRSNRQYDSNNRNDRNANRTNFRKLMLGIDLRLPISMTVPSCSMFGIFGNIYFLCFLSSQPIVYSTFSLSFLF